MSCFNQFSGKVIKVLKFVTKNWFYEVDFGKVKIKRKGGLGFLKREHSKEEKFLSSLPLNNKTVFDIGGYIGLMTVYFSKSVGSGKVVVFEPNESNITRIKTHLGLNGVSNARIIPFGVANEKKNLSFVVREGSEATGSLDKGIQSLLKQQGGWSEYEIRVDTLDNLVNVFSLAAPDFIKVDIEGMEFPALLGMKNTIAKFAPQFFIEIHGSTESFKKDNIRNVFEFFVSFNYSVFHVESEQFLSYGNVEIAKEGHIYCKPNK
jgi:FkbM family methyltransferase